MQERQRAHTQAHGGHAVHAVFQPLLLGQQRNRGQGNRHLQRGGGLGPAVVVVQVGLALLIEGVGIGLQLFGRGLDLVLLFFVAVDLGLVFDLLGFGRVRSRASSARLCLVLLDWK